MISYDRQDTFTFEYKPSETGFNFADTATGLHFSLPDIDFTINSHMQMLTRHAVNALMERVKAVQFSEGDTLSITVRVTAEGVFMTMQ